MERHRKGVACAVVSAALAVSGSTAYSSRARAAPERGSCLAITGDSIVIVADTEGDALVRVELEQADRTTRLPLSGHPEQVLVVPGGRVVVTRRSEARVTMLDIATLAVVADVQLGVEPFGLALSADRSEVYVTDVQRRMLVALDADDLAFVWAAPLPDDDARSVVVAPDGRRAYVAHLRSPRVSVVDLRRRTFTHALALPEHTVGARRAKPNRATSLELSSDGRTLLVAMDLVDPGVVPAQLVCSSYGCRRADDPPPVHGAIARVPLGRGRARRAVAEVMPVLDPSDIRWDASAGTVWMSGAGMTGGVGRSERYTECIVPTQRWLVSHHPLTSSLRVVPRVPWLCTGGASCGDVASNASPEVREVALGREDDLARRIGSHLFHVPNARISRHAALACQTCHPDGRQDGQVWAGRAGRLSTPVLAGRLDLTAPYHWHGSARRLEDSIRETVSRLGGSGLEPDETRLLSRFVRYSLPPVPRANAGRGPTADEQRGAELFDELGCARCHDPDNAYTNGRSYALLPSDDPHVAAPELDVPSLRSLRLGAPYLHDGRASDLGVVLDGGSMGARASRLPRADRAALIAYLETL